MRFGNRGKAGEDENADGNEHDEKPELFVAAMQRVAERLEPGRVTRQLEDAQNSHDAKDLHHPAGILYLRRRDTGGLRIGLDPLASICCGFAVQQAVRQIHN